MFYKDNHVTLSCINNVEDRKSIEVEFVIFLSEKVKDFTCSVCQLAFSSRAAMRTHKKKHDVKR